MMRSRLLSMAAILGLGVTGCVHCDTCDDFPVPCSGPGCNASIRPMTPPPWMAAPGPGPMQAAPEGATPATSTPTMEPPSPPEPPAETTTPPTPPVAPEGPVNPEPGKPTDPAAPPPANPENG